MNRRAMTFVEVVVAVALLAVLASTVFSAFDFMLGRQRIEQQTLAAHEVAGRLMLSFLDDHNAMPDSNLPVEYGTDRYRWELQVDPIKIQAAEPAHPDPAPAVLPGRERTPLADRVRQITVRVWLSEESGGSAFPDESVPHARLTRLLYALSSRNPDSFENMMKSDSGLRGYMDEILGASPNSRSGAGAGRNATTPTGRQPASGTPGAKR